MTLEANENTFLALGLALGLGMLVGLQRERAAEPLAGIRTFPLITLLGCLSALLYESLGAAMPAVALGAVTVTLITASTLRALREKTEMALTTEIAALVMFCTGALLGLHHAGAAVVISGAVALLLNAKEPLHQFSRAMGDKDFHAVMRLVLISLVILPVLPDRTMDHFQALNPFRIWLIVVFVFGISMAAYVIQRLLGGGRGALVAGLLGGFISSTAATVTYARSVGAKESSPATATVVILVASATVFVRVLAIVAVLAPSALLAMVQPFVAMALLMTLVAVVAYFLARQSLAAPTVQEPPTDLRPALIFGLMFAVILFAVAVVRSRFGVAGLYPIAAIAGLTDVDAIVLSTAQLTQLTDGKQITPELAWHVILVGVLANIVFKGAVAGVFGGLRLLLPVGAAFLVALAGGAYMLIAWA